jgi:hypothetical protein
MEKADHGDKEVFYYTFGVSWLKKIPFPLKPHRDS